MGSNGVNKLLVEILGHGPSKDEITRYFETYSYMYNTFLWYAANSQEYKAQYTPRIHYDLELTNCRVLRHSCKALFVFVFNMLFSVNVTLGAFYVYDLSMCVLLNLLGADKFILQQHM